MSSPIRRSHRQEVGPPCPANWSAFAGPTPQQLWSTNPFRTLPLGGCQSRDPCSYARATRTIRPWKSKCGASRLKAGDYFAADIENRNTTEVADFAVTNARFCFASRAAGRPFPPLDHARSTPQTARSSRASIRNVAQRRRASVCGSAAALRSGSNSLCAPLRPPLHFPRSPTTDRSRKSEVAKNRIGIGGGDRNRTGE